MNRFLVLFVLLQIGLASVVAAAEEPAEEHPVELCDEDREVLEMLELLEMMELLNDLEDVAVLEDNL
jgi:hypothetical protein